MLWMTLLTGAHGFCGAFVGAADTAPTNTTSHVVWALENDRTTLTMYNDVAVAKAGDIGLLLPLPEVLSADDVGTVYAERFTDLEAATAPRSVAYTCDTLPANGVVSNSRGCGTDTLLGLTDADEPSDVIVHERFTAGSWDVAILDATSADPLLDWLLDEGFPTDDATLDTVDAVLDSGEAVLAARVKADAEWLTPLQVRYPMASYTLPVALGTLSSSGTQDLVIHTLTSSSVDIANYPQAHVQTDCLFDPDEAPLDELYGDLLDDALQPVDGQAAWVKEYARSWAPASGGKCDPCPPEPDSPAEDELDDELLDALGFTGGRDSVFVTRLRLRYAPDEVDQDLVLQPTGVTALHQQRYIVEAPIRELYETWPRCGGDVVEVPEDLQLQTCSASSGPAGPSSASCAVPGGRGASGFATLVLLALARRRRASL